MLRLDAAVASDVGAHREQNQDAAFAAPWAAGVADGVGGAPAGDLASAAFVHRLVAGGPRCEDADQLAMRIRGANWDLGAHVRRDPELRGMATTFTGLWFTGAGELLLAHTGDSRAYLLRGGLLTRQTRDDSFVQLLVDQGLVSERDAVTHPRRNLITASLSGDEQDPVRVSPRSAMPGDRWLLCSDGVSDYLPVDLLESLLDPGIPPQPVAHHVVAAALRAGSRDNVTAVVCDVVEWRDDEAAAQGQTLFAGAAATRFAEGLDPDLLSA